MNLKKVDANLRRKKRIVEAADRTFPFTPPGLSILQSSGAR